MSALTPNEQWIVDAGYEVIRKEAGVGINGLSPMERLIYCLWVADYGIRNVGNLVAFADIQTDAIRFAHDLGLSLTQAALALPAAELQRRYFDLFDAVCEEVKRLIRTNAPLKPIRTLKLSSHESYLKSEYPATASSEAREELIVETAERNERLARFPYAIMLEVAFPERDFADRWCWENLGPAAGDCHQMYSEYPVCTQTTPHSHSGKWASHWFVKTEYDFGFNEWYFAAETDRERFREFIPSIHWGELYAK